MDLASTYTSFSPRPSVNSVTGGTVDSASFVLLFVLHSCGEKKHRNDSDSGMKRYVALVYHCWIQVWKYMDPKSQSFCSLNFYILNHCCMIQSPIVQVKWYQKLHSSSCSKIVCCNDPKIIFLYITNGRVICDYITNHWSKCQFDICIDFVISYFKQS